jgi:cell division septation protein DedD
MLARGGITSRSLLVAGSVLLLVLLAAVSGCRKSAPPTGQVSQPPPEAATQPQTGTPPADQAHIPQPPPPEPPPPTGAENAGEGWTTGEPGRSTYGYRVQIFASSQKDRAEEIAAEARTRFSERVYVVYDAPFYKVRVGDCITRQEADVLKEKASAQGYEAPWVAETMVEAR